MGQPWNALTELLLSPEAPSDERALLAWEEAAGRLGLTRLGWCPGAAGGDPGAEPRLVHPNLRAVVRWRHASTPGGAPTSGEAAEDFLVVEAPGGRLVAAAARGELPSRRTLDELGTLAAALETRRQDRAQLRLARSRARGARRALGAAHDLRNELTRALLLEARERAATAEDGGPGDGGATDTRAELRRALAAARDLASLALQGEEPLGGPAPLEEVPLRELLGEECRAAAAAARVDPASMPRLRVKAPKAAVVLARAGSFARAVRNLVTNALEAAARRRGAGGTVSVSASRAGEAAPGTRDERLAWAGFGWVLTVEDDGVGMGEERVASFLEAPPGDARLAELEAGRPSSTGLGTASLAVALEESGLPLRVESAHGRGTVVRVWLRGAGARGAGEMVIVDRDLRRGARRWEAAGGAGRAVWVDTENAAALLREAAAR